MLGLVRLEFCAHICHKGFPKKLSNSQAPFQIVFIFLILDVKELTPEERERRLKEESVAGRYKGAGTVRSQNFSRFEMWTKVTPLSLSF